MKHRTLKAIITNIIITVLVYFILSFLLVMLIYEGLFARTDDNGYRLFITYDDMEYPCREVTFSSGVFTLRGRVYNSDGQEGVVILGHSKGGRGEDMLAEARYFADNGFAAMVFDLTGHGESDGTGQRGLCCAADDMESAVRFCSQDEQLSGKPIFLYGSGVSGYGAALCASMEQVKAIAAVSAFASAPEVTLEYAFSQMNVFAYLEYPVMLLYQYIMFGDKLGRNAVDEINASNVPVLVIHGTADEVISISGSALYAKQESVKNPNFRALAVDGGAHTSLMRSGAAIEYLVEFNSEAYSLYQQYNSNVPTYTIKELYERYDRDKMSELNAGLMGEVLDLFLSAR